MRQTRFQELKQATRLLRKRTAAALAGAGPELAELERAMAERVIVDEAKLTLAMAGEFSVGKSSLIKALTGLDVPVGAGVTTSAVHRYEFGDLVLVDMPGTLSGQMDHDAIARRAISDADLILFVVSNELFNAESLPYFKVAAEQLAKKHQMLLVVNKFDRFNLGGRTPDEAVRFIGGVLAEEIRPLDIDDFGPVVVSSKDYLAGTETDDAEKRARRFASSRFDVLRERIDEFTARRGVLAQQVRPLQQLLELIDEAMTIALADDGSRTRAEALIRRRIFAIVEARSLARIELRKVRHSARSRFLEPSEKILKLMDERVTQEEMDAAAAIVEGDLEHIVKQVGDELTVLHERLIADLTERLDEIDASPLAQQVRAEFDASFDGPDVSGLGAGLSPNARKAVVAGLKKGSAFMTENSKQVADALGEVFKFFGGRFKPWGKVKLGEWVGKAGRVLGPLVAVGEAYFNYRAEIHKEHAERLLRSLRAELRAQFHDAAGQFDAALREQEEKLLHVLYEEPLTSAQQLAASIVAGVKGKANLAEELSAISQEIRTQIGSVTA